MKTKTVGQMTDKELFEETRGSNTAAAKWVRWSTNMKRWLEYIDKLNFFDRERAHRRRAMAKARKNRQSGNM